MQVKIPYTPIVITLTEAASTEFKKILKDQEWPEDSYIRVAIRGKNEDGFIYTLNIQDRPNGADEVTVVSDIQISYDSRSREDLAGLTIDFFENIGFRFIQKVETGL